MSQGAWHNEFYKKVVKDVVFLRVYVSLRDILLLSHISNLLGRDSSLSYIQSQIARVVLQGQNNPQAQYQHSHVMQRKQGQWPAESLVQQGDKRMQGFVLKLAIDG